MQQANPVLMFVSAYKAAVLAKDLEAFCSLYAEDVSVFDAWGGPWSMTGIAPLRSSTRKWFASLNDQRVQVTEYEVQASEHGSLAFGHGVLRFTALSPAGEPLRWLENRLSVCLRQEGGVWKVCHQHTSSPADFMSKTVQLSRVADDA